MGGPRGCGREKRPGLRGKKELVLAAWGPKRDLYFGVEDTRHGRLACFPCVPSRQVFSSKMGAGRWHSRLFFHAVVPWPACHSSGTHGRNLRGGRRGGGREGYWAWVWEGGILDGLRSEGLATQCLGQRQCTSVYGDHIYRGKLTTAGELLHRLPALWSRRSMPKSGAALGLSPFSRPSSTTTSPPSPITCQPESHNY